MANNYYNFPIPFVPGTKVRSDQVNTEYQGLETAFDLLPTDPTASTTGRGAWASDSTGAGNAYEVTMPNTRLANTDGDEVIFRADKTNTGATTLNVDGLGAVPLVRADDSALVAGDITSGLLYIARYDLAHLHFQLVVPTASYLAAAAASAAAALASENAAATSESNAATSESNAAASAAAALISENNAAGWESLANEWAENPEDVAVTGHPGEFSAFHWSQKALVNANLPVGTALGDQIEWDGAGAYQISTKQDWVGTGYAFVGPSAGDPTVPDNITNLHFLRTTDANNYGSFGFDNSTDLVLRNFAYNGRIIIAGVSSAGTPYNVMEITPDNFTHFNYAGTRVLSVRNDGIGIRGSLNTGPGTIQDTYILLENRGGTDIGGIGFYINSLDMSLTCLNHGGSLVLEGEDTLGVLQNVLVGNPDNSVVLYEAGLPSIETGANGFRTYSSTIGDPTVPEALAVRMQFYSADSNEYGRVGYLTGTDLIVRNLAHGGAVRLEGESNAGLARNIFVGDPDATADLYMAGAIAMRTSSNGIDVRGLLTNDPTAGGVQDQQVRFQNTDAETSGFVGFPTSSSDNIELHNNVRGGDVVLRVENAVGTGQVGVQVIPDNVVQLSYAGVVKALTATTGFDIRGSLGNDPALGGVQNTLYELSNNTGVRVADVGFLGGDTLLQIRNRVHGGNVQLSSEDTATGASQVILLGNPDGSCLLYHNGDYQAGTAADGWTVFGTGTNNPALGGTQDGRLILENQSFVEVGHLGHSSSTILEIRNDVWGGDIRARARNAAGTVNILWSADPDGVFFAHYAGTQRIATRATGVFQIKADDDVTTSVNRLDFANASAVAHGAVGFDASTTMILRNSKTSGLLSLQGENAALTTVTMASFDPDAGYLFKYDNETVLDSSTGGITRFHPLSAATTEGGEIRLMGAAANDDISIDTVSGRARIFNATLGEQYIDCNPNSSVNLYYNGSVKVTTALDGIAVRGSLNPAIGGTQDSYVLLEDSDGTDIGAIGFVNSTTMSISSFNHGATVLIQGENAAGTPQTMVAGFPDAGTFLYTAGVAVLNTRSDGIDIRGSGNPGIAVAQDAWIKFTQEDGTTRIGTVGYPNGTTTFTLRGEVTSGNLALEARDAGTTLRSLLVGDPDAAVNLYYDGSSTARTAAAASGGLEANNTETGAGFERVLTESDGVIASAHKTSATSRQNTTTIAVDPDLVISLPVGEWAIEGMLVVDFGAGGLKISPNGATPANTSGRVLFMDEELNTMESTAVDSTVNFTGRSGTDQGITISGRVTVITGTTDFRISWAQITSNAAFTRLEGTCWIKATKLP